MQLHISSYKFKNLQFRHNKYALWHIGGKNIWTGTWNKSIFRTIKAMATLSYMSLSWRVCVYARARERESKPLKELLITMKEGEHVNMVRAEACPLLWSNVTCSWKQELWWCGCGWNAQQRPCQFCQCWVAHCILFPPSQWILPLGQRTFSKIQQDLWNICDNKTIKNVFALCCSHYLCVQYDFSIKWNATHTLHYKSCTLMSPANVSHLISSQF